MVALIPMSSAKMTDVSQPLEVLALRFIIPARCIIDSGPQLRHLVNESNQELNGGLSLKKIELIVVPDGLQFANPAEQSIKEVKKIFRRQIQASTPNQIM